METEIQRVKAFVEKGIGKVRAKINQNLANLHGANEVLVGVGESKAVGGGNRFRGHRESGWAT